MRISEISNRFFQFQERGTRPHREVIAGMTAFLTVAYLLVLIPTFLAGQGMHFDSVMSATVITAVIGTLMMGLIVNYPFIVAPGVAMVVYIHYVIIERWQMPWQTVMGTIFLVGCLLMVLTLFKVRKLIMATVPDCLRLAAIAGIGVFLMVIGLQNGTILVRKDLFFTLNFSFTFPQVMVILGLGITGLLLIFRFPAALFMGMLFVGVLSAFFGHTDVQHVVAWPHSVTHTFLKLDVLDALQPKYLNALISLLFVALFDATGALVALSHRLAVKQLPLQRIFICDAFGSFLAGSLGTAPAAIYLESLSGIAAGGRTGLTSIVAAGCMALSLFFTPLIAAIPIYVTAPVLIILGGSMVASVIHLPWKDPTEWIAGCITFILIPISLNIAAGIGIGYLTYCVLKAVTGRAQEVRVMTWIIAAFFLLKFLFPYLLAI